MELIFFFILGLINVTRQIVGKKKKIVGMDDWSTPVPKFNHLSGKWIINPVINFIINSIRIIPGNFAARM